MEVTTTCIVEGMLSTLPDEILGSIVSFLPKESALETSLISKRWRQLWNQVLVAHGSLQDITGVLAKFLANFEEHDPLKHPRKLQFHYDHHQEQGSVLLASIATNSKLLLDFSACDDINHKELESRYDLQLITPQQQYSMAYQQVPPSSSTFLVKTLYLKSVRVLTSVVVSSIVSNLEHLENLVISDCSGLKSLSIESESKLHKLTILDCLHLKHLHLRTSKLKSFTYRGLLPRIWVWPESHFNLTHAKLDFRLGPISTDFRPQDFDESLLTIKNSQVLTLCQWTFEALIWPSISPSSGNFIFYKLKELCWIGSHKDENSINALLSFLKLCPALEQLSFVIDPKSYSYWGSRTKFLCLKQETKYKELQHLKLIKLMGFTNRAEEVSVAKRLVGLAVKKGKIPTIEASDGNYLGN
ncbi:hypothetical protein PIB30_039492 [Stylosanthes scabra]|uniref:F-box domain-containing protein n=1 Tax=Stylosanthes scabra TaxID=79078 RepID=A0ABU6YD62_9FABA|nr:hypothetical protein [Stylosanthes scabra]